MEIPGIAERLLMAIGGDRRGNQKKAAQRLGIAESVLSGWLKENKYGKCKSPSAEHLRNIHEKLGIDLNWLISGEGQMRTPAAKGVAEPAEHYESLAPSIRQSHEKVLAVWERIAEGKRGDALRILEALAAGDNANNDKPAP